MSQQTPNPTAREIPAPRVSIAVDASSMWFDAREYGASKGINSAMLDYNMLRRFLLSELGGRHVESWVYINKKAGEVGLGGCDMEPFSRALNHMSYNVRVVVGEPCSVSAMISEEMRVNSYFCDILCLVSREGDYTTAMLDLLKSSKRVSVCNFNQPGSSILFPIEQGIRHIQLDERCLMSKGRGRR